MVTASRAGMAAAYAYDIDDRRIGKTVTQTSTISTRTLWSGTDELAEYDGAGALLRRVIPGPGIDDKVAVVEVSGAVSYFHTDRLGSVVAVSNGAGAASETYAYSPYGESANPVTGNPWRYTGRYLDAETGLYYYRARYFSPRLGQFLQTDPIGSKDDPNLYMYVGLDPGNKTDPLGLEGWCGGTCIPGTAGGDRADEERRAMGPAIANSWPVQAAAELIAGCLEGGCQGVSGAFGWMRGVPNSGAIPGAVVDEMRLGHIFRNAPGHLPTASAENISKLEKLTERLENFLGVDKRGKSWFGKVEEDGTQTWAEVINGKIVNGGINTVPRVFNSETGLSRQVPPNARGPGPPASPAAPPTSSTPNGKGMSIVPCGRAAMPECL